MAFLGSLALAAVSGWMLREWQGTSQGLPPALRIGGLSMIMFVFTLAYIAAVLGA